VVISRGLHLEQSSQSGLRAGGEHLVGRGATEVEFNHQVLKSRRM
jgi:hypothetical protein